METVLNLFHFLSVTGTGVLLNVVWVEFPSEHVFSFRK